MEYYQEDPGGFITLAVLMVGALLGLVVSLYYYFTKEEDYLTASLFVCTGWAMGAFLAIPMALILTIVIVAFIVTLPIGILRESIRYLKGKTNEKSSN